MTKSRLIEMIRKTADSWAWQSDEINFPEKLADQILSELRKEIEGMVVTDYIGRIIMADDLLENLGGKTKFDPKKVSKPIKIWEGKTR
jgi:hypothetical protein